MISCCCSDNYVLLTAEPTMKNMLPVLHSFVITPNTHQTIDLQRWELARILPFGTSSVKSKSFDAID